MSQHHYTHTRYRHYANSDGILASLNVKSVNTLLLYSNSEMPASGSWSLFQSEGRAALSIVSHSFSLHLPLLFCVLLSPLLSLLASQHPCVPLADCLHGTVQAGQLLQSPQLCSVEKHPLQTPPLPSPPPSPPPVKWHIWKCFTFSYLVTFDLHLPSFSLCAQLCEKVSQKLGLDFKIPFLTKSFSPSNQEGTQVSTYSICILHCVIVHTTI